MHPSNRADCFPFPLFSGLFDFQRGKTPPRKSKSGLSEPAFPRFARARHTPFFIGGGAMYVSFESRLLFLPFPLFSGLFDFSAWKIAPLQKQKRPCKARFRRGSPVPSTSRFLWAEPQCTYPSNRADCFPFPLFSSLFDFSAWENTPMQKQKRPRAAAAFCAISR